VDAGIQAAVVGGAIGGATVGLSVCGQHFHFRITARRADVEAAVTELDQVTRRLAQQLFFKEFDLRDPEFRAALDPDIDRLSDLVVTYLPPSRRDQRRLGPPVHT
jgi:hypothetical protein